MRRRLILALLPVLLWTTPAAAQNTAAVTDTITANGDAVTLINAAGLGTARVQVTGTYDSTWEAQCAVRDAGGTLAFDTDDEILMTKEGTTTTTDEVTNDAEAIWSMNIAGCAAVRIIATGFTSGTQTVTILAVESGGGAGGGGAAAAVTGTVDIEVGGVAPALGSGVAANALLVEIASDSNVNTSLDAIADNTAAIAAGLAAESIHGNPVIATGPASLGEAKTFDGSALPNAVTEGQAVRQAFTLSGVSYSFLTNADGSKQLGKLEDDAHASADYGLPVLTRRIDTPATSAGSSGDYATLDTDASGNLHARINSAANGNAVIACNNHVVINTATSGNVELVALSGSTVIYICSYAITAEATVDVRLVKGTGTACATNEVSLTGTYAFSTTTGMLGLARGSGLGSLSRTAGGDALCIELGGAVQINGEISYAQF